MTLITVENLSVSFDSVRVFENMSFKVESGDYLCILGENGSGKTTLMRCLTGNDVRYSGKISYHGFLKRDIGWLPQRTETKRDFPASVLEVVLSGFAGKGLFGFRYTDMQKKTALKNMELLEITALKNRSFKELSGGQQQKTLLCRAMCAVDKVLLLDEPTAGLDISAQNELYAQIRRLKESGMTVIMISHDVERALNEATHILNIGHNGYFFGTPEQFRSTFKNEKDGVN